MQGIPSLCILNSLAGDYTCLMKGIFRQLLLALMLFALLTGCDRNKESADSGMHSEPGVVPQESDQWGYLAVKIAKVYEKQKPLEQAPWHADGGDWTFLDCSLAKDPGIKFVVGARTRTSDKSEIPVSWGEALIAVSDPGAGGQFVEAFARAFHAQPPPSHGNKPAGFLKLHTAVLGEGLARDAKGGFKGGRGGTWSATKWFLQDDTAEAEVYFNYSPSEKRAEFAEKDEEYRDDLMQQLVLGLRDGPLPERTPENDPNLTLTGPRVANWKRIAETNETCQFSPDGGVLAITASEGGTNSKIYLAPITNPSERKFLGQFEGMTLVQEFLSLDQGRALVVAETIRKNPKALSTSDPQKLWLVDAQGRHEIAVPANLTNWFAFKKCVSPNGAFIALHRWQNGAGKKNSRVIHLGNLRTGAWQKIEMPGVELELVDWPGKTPAGAVLTGSDYGKDEVRKAYSLDLATGKLSPLESIPAEFVPGNALSPDGTRSAHVIEKDRLVITDVATGRKHEFIFHPYDRRNAYADSVQWVNDHYLVFQGARTALINADTLKMSFVEEKGSDIKGVEFAPGFKLALGTKEDGHYLGEVQAAQ